MVESKDENFQQVVERRLAELKALPIICAILDRLRNELPPDLYYHNACHTEDVLEEVVAFATYDELAEREIELLAIAAAYHDAGFLVTRTNNEAIGATLAKEALEQSGDYQPDEISLIVRMIEDTKIITDSGELKQIPSSHLSKYLLDADVSNLGREDFWENNRLLQRETSMEQTAFRELTKKLFINHYWLTRAAKALRDSQRKLNEKVFLVE